MDIARKDPVLGNFSLYILFVILLSFVFSLYLNLPTYSTGGNLSNDARTQLGYHKDNFLGLFTHYFVHENTSHLISNLIFLVPLFIFALFLEKRDEEFKRLSILKWIVFPLTISTILLVYFVLKHDNYGVGSSYFLYYAAGFVFIIGIRVLLAYFSLPRSQTSKSKISFSFIFRGAVYALLAFLLVPFMFIAGFVNVNAATASLHGFALFFGFVFGIWYCLRKTCTVMLNSTLKKISSKFP